MKNVIEVSFGIYYYERFLKPIREKQDSIKVILDVLSILLIQEEQGRSCKKGNIVIKVDKMSRLFCFLENKYFSMAFPFHIETKEVDDNNYKIQDSILNMEIDNRLISLLEYMLSRVDFVNDKMDEILENTYFDISEEGYTQEETENCFQLMMCLLSMEIGYIRYDYDPERENGSIHPLYHFDVNYSSGNTYKLGLHRKVEKEEFIDFLDIKTECHYIE